MRCALVQIREFLINGNWYDMRLPAIGAPEALNSHWSRLIDLPVAWLISVFALFTPYLLAEKLAMIAWPLILLFAMARFFVHEAERRSSAEAGARAGVILLVLLLLCATGLFQFMPGRIDHHNVQILFAVVSLILLQRAITDPRAGWLAGVTMATGLVVGFEALPLLAALLGVACLVASFDAGARPGVTRAVIGLFATLIVGFVISTHPSAWSAVACDKLSLNILGLVGAGAVAAGVLAMRFGSAPYWIWIAGFGVSGVVGIGLYFGANPVCAGGAFTGMDAIVKEHWLARVLEGQSLFSFFSVKPEMVVAYLVTMTMALAIVVHTALKSPTSTNIFGATCLILATLYGFYYLKFMPYGPLLSLVPLACWIANLSARGSTPADSMQIRAIIVMNQTLYVVSITVLIGLYSNVTGTRKANADTGTVSACSYRTDIASLSQLPQGLVAADIDLGPYIAVSTRHRAYAGPYHRIHTSIRDTLLLLHSPMSEAAKHLARMDADYLVLCGSEKKAGGAQHTATDMPASSSARSKVPSFSQVMRNGGTFPGLEPVSIGKTRGPLKVWKVVKPAP